jgi:membrane fusion protein, multidrug efflux system
MERRRRPTSLATRNQEHSLAEPRTAPRRRGWIAAIVLLVAAAGGYFGWRHFAQSGGAPPVASAPKAAIPVTVARAETADFPVYLDGLGTVEPYDTVTVRSRVDGEVVKIAFRQGQMVNQGDTLAQIDPRPYQAALDQALAKKAQDEANLKNAQLNLQRYDTLAKQDFASRQQLDTQQATVDQLTAQIKGDQAAIDNAQTQVSYTTIQSPLSGKTGFRLVDPGNIVHAADTTGIVTIVKLQPISVVFTAPEENVPEINKALAAGTAPVIALSSDGLRTLSRGHLALVNNAVDQASGAIRMKATFDNTDNVLWPGLSVSTRLLVDTLKQVVVVPADGVERGPKGLYAFVVGDDNKVEIRDIKVGQEDLGRAVVLEGLSPGQRIVTAGQYRLQEGALVQPTEANPSPPPDQSAQNPAVPSPPAKAP